MNYFPDEQAGGTLAKWSVVVLPLFYLVVALLYSANSAPWGLQVDPESAYAMNGLAWAAGYPMVKSDHPGTTTTLLLGLIVKLWAFLTGHSDVVEFGLKNYDAIVYTSRAGETVILSGALLAAGVIVRNTTKSSFAAMIFQTTPLLSAVALHFEAMLIPESLMASCAILGMALVLKAALNKEIPSLRLGMAQGLVFALGLSSKFLHLPLSVMCVSLLRGRKAFVAAIVTSVFAFFLINRVLHPLVFTGGFHWLVRLATHKGIYGKGETGFIDFGEFWGNMGLIIKAEPVIFSVFAMGLIVALIRIVTSRQYSDPVSLTLLAAVLAFSELLVATSKHFALHYMLAAWALAGGTLVLTIVETRRVFPQLAPKMITAAAVAACAVMVSSTLSEIKKQASQNIALNNVGESLSKAVVANAPSCANVSSMYVRAPENDLNFGADETFGFQEIRDRFSDAYARTFEVPLLDHSYYQAALLKNFRPYTYSKLASEYPCIVVRTAQELDEQSSLGLLELNPDHCIAEGGIHIYSVGIACKKISERSG